MEWIRVEDRLPDDKQAILVWYSKTQWPYDVNISVKRYSNSYSGGFNVLITHWMPLPPPPKDTP